MNLTRRSFLASAFAATLASRLRADEPSHGLAPFDKLMTEFLEKHQVPGAALAVARQGKIVHAQGYGFADRDAQEPVKADSRFRIASVSKPITAVAILQLVEKGKLKLDDPVLDLLPFKPLLTKEAKFDERWKKITVRHCLTHTGGWDRSKSYDPIVKAWEIAKAFEVEPPIGPERIVRYMMGQPLDFNPGERYAYSNLGYLVLGRLIATLSGQEYEPYVKQHIFKPLGITTAQLGKALREDRANGEVTYYDRRKGTGRCLYPPKLGETVPVVYGAMNLEAYEAHGGWIASAIDLAKFASAFDNPAKCPILSQASIATMWESPKENTKPVFYGLGWQVRRVGTKSASNHWHTGFIPGSEALLVRRHDGLNWAVLFNTSNTPDGKTLSGTIDPHVHDAANAVNKWPDQ